MPNVTQLVKGWAKIRIIMANVSWLVSHSIRLSILIHDLIEVSQQLHTVSILYPQFIREIQIVLGTQSGIKFAN